jgi:hypothetical protein
MSNGKNILEKVSIGEKSSCRAPILLLNLVWSNRRVRFDSKTASLHIGVVERLRQQFVIHHLSLFRVTVPSWILQKTDSEPSHYVLVLPGGLV